MAEELRPIYTFGCYRVFRHGPSNYVVDNSVTGVSFPRKHRMLQGAKRFAKGRWDRDNEPEPVSMQVGGLAAHVGLLDG